MSCDIKTDLIKIGVNQSIWISQNGNTEFRKIGIAFFIVCSVFGCQMLPSVKFNDQFFTVDIKIDDIIKNYFLAMNRKRQWFQKLIP